MSPARSVATTPRWWRRRPPPCSCCRTGGSRWPLVGVRHQMLEEAVEIIRALWAGGTVTYRGRHFEVESARVWDLPEVAPPIGIAVSGPASCRLAGRHADAMITTEPRAELGQLFDGAGGPASPASARS